MKITVESAAKFKHPDFIKVLESIEEPKYTFLGMDKFNFIAMNFEVDTDKDVNEIVGLTKGILKKAPELLCINFRVVPTGNEFFYKK